MNRRNFFSGAATAVAAASVSRVALAALPEPATQSSADTAPPLHPPTGRPYNPVVTLNGWTAPWRMNAGVKEFHLVAEPVVREVAPGFMVNMWGYNGQSPGPTIEVVEGDRVRIFVTNRLPEHTTIHWHGQRLPNGMDGVCGHFDFAASSASRIQRAISCCRSRGIRSTVDATLMAPTGSPCVLRTAIPTASTPRVAWLPITDQPRSRVVRTSRRMRSGVMPP